MRLILFLLLSNVNGFIFNNPVNNILIKPKLTSRLEPLFDSNMTPNKPTDTPKPLYDPNMEMIRIKPLSSIIYYEMTNYKRLEIQEDINNRTNSRFVINTNYIHVSQYDYNNNQSRCQIFVYVYDKETQLTGEYILESIEYNVPRTESLICSFYENNRKFYTSFSYYQYAMDNGNYDANFDIKFIYQDEKYYKNYNPFSKVSYVPSYSYNSELKYRNNYWKKANKITYYKNYINYYLID